MSKKKNTEKKLIRKKTYTITWEIYDDFSTSLFRENDGFSVIELMGISSMINSDMSKLMAESMKIDKIERKATNAKLIDP